MTLGSLFDGAGTCPFAGIITGFVPVWASEIEPFPIAVTSKRFPRLKHLGDITKLNSATMEPVDFITFGSPCQDLSVAGKRAGIGGARSGLFMEAIRIFKEMRGATNGQYPKIVMWENVPGAFTSNRGEDFRIVLEEICKIKDSDAFIPRPQKWSDAGLILGNGYSVAWRVLDSQFWGVPQRRRRIFLVADFGGQCAGEILFEPEGLQRSFAESSQAWNSYSDPAENGVDKEVYDARGKGDGRICPTITGDHENRITDYTALVCGVDMYNQTMTGDVSCSTITANNAGGGQRMPDKDNFNCVIQNDTVRRLTPRECGKLQGMPSWWCDDVPHKDSLEYKMWGNGMALPCVLYVFENVRTVLLRREVENLMMGKTEKTHDKRRIKKSVIFRKPGKI